MSSNSKLLSSTDASMVETQSLFELEAASRNVEAHFISLRRRVFLSNADTIRVVIAMISCSCDYREKMSFPIVHGLCIKEDDILRTSIAYDRTLRSNELSLS